MYPLETSACFRCPINASDFQYLREIKNRQYKALKDRHIFKLTRLPAAQPLLPFY